MPPTYSIYPVTEARACHDCGDPADILIVPDADDASGYRGEIALCNECRAKREQ